MHPKAPPKEDNDPKDEVQAMVTKNLKLKM